MSFKQLNNKCDQSYLHKIRKFKKTRQPYCCSENMALPGIPPVQAKCNTIEKKKDKCEHCKDLWVRHTLIVCAHVCAPCKRFLQCNAFFMAMDVYKLHVFNHYAKQVNIETIFNRYNFLFWIWNYTDVWYIILILAVIITQN